MLLHTQLLRGELDREGYVPAMETVLHVIDQEPRLAPMLPMIDAKRLLLMTATMPSAPTMDGSENGSLRAAS